MYLGLDVSKAKIDCCLMIEKRCYYKVIDNNLVGFTKLQQWLSKFTDKTVHACCEATGSYSVNIADYLHELGHKVSVVNPLKIKSFVTSELQNVKTDKQDAKSIAIYCYRNQPALYSPPSSAERELKALTRHLDSLKQSLTALRNRYQVSHSSVQVFINEQMNHIKQQIKHVQRAIQSRIKSDKHLNGQSQLLKSIVGIGDATVAHLLTLFAEKDFKNSKQVTKYVGLNPIIKQSGNKSTRHLSISKMGDKHVRKALYMPAVVAYRMKVFQPFIDRLQSKGKTNKQIICAMMRKLLVYCYAVLKTGVKFNLELLTKT